MKNVIRKEVNVNDYLAKKLHYKNYNEFLTVLEANKIQQLKVQNYNEVSFKVLETTYKAKSFLGFKSIVDFVTYLKECNFIVKCSYAFDNSINVCITHNKFNAEY